MKKQTKKEQKQMEIVRSEGIVFSDEYPEQIKMKKSEGNVFSYVYIEDYSKEIENTILHFTKYYKMYNVISRCILDIDDKYMNKELLEKELDQCFDKFRIIYFGHIRDMLDDIARHFTKRNNNIYNINYVKRYKTLIDLINGEYELFSGHTLADLIFEQYDEST